MPYTELENKSECCGSELIDTQQVILQCLQVLQAKAQEHNGGDYLAVFEDEEKSENLWLIEDSAITALLPSDY